MGSVELGRPLGEPGDAAFQRNVLKAMFELFGEASGPVTHEYEVDAPTHSTIPSGTRRIYRVLRL